MIEIGVTYEIFTPESIEFGDAEERGWEWETQEWKPDGTLRDMLRDFKGCQIEPSDSQLGPGTWFTAYKTNDGTREYYETGAEKNLSLHISGASAGTIRRIWRMLQNGDY